MGGLEGWWEGYVGWEEWKVGRKGMLGWEEWKVERNGGMEKLTVGSNGSCWER